MVTITAGGGPHETARVCPNPHQAYSGRAAAWPGPGWRGGEPRPTPGLPGDADTSQPPHTSIDAPPEGCRRCEPVRTRESVKHTGWRVLRAMEPSGLDGLARDARLTGWGDEVCVVHGQAVCPNRKTMQESPSPTDAQEADSVFARLQPGKGCLPVARAPERKAASRVRPRPMARKQRGRQLRQQLRTALPLAFPAWHARRQALPQPTARRFLHTTPPPATVLRIARPARALGPCPGGAHRLPRPSCLPSARAARTPTARHSSPWQAALSVCATVAPGSGHSHRARLWAVPTCAPGSLTMPSAWSLLSPPAEPTTNGASHRPQAQGRANGLGEPSPRQSAACAIVS